jgi:hypothetical protein
MKTKLALCIITLAGCFLCGNIFADATGNATISNVTAVNGECVQSTINPTPNGDVQFWDVQAGGTYDVTLSNVTDCASQGNDSTIGVIVQNSVGGNICPLTANQTATGVYTFRVTLGSQCETMPILYCTTNCLTNTGLKAQDAPGGKLGHLRIATFDGNCAVVTNPSCSASPTPPPTASITACKFYDKNANGVQDAGEPPLTGWPFCINPLGTASPALQTQLTANGGCVTWSNLTVPGDYTVTEANANESNWFHSPDPLPPPLIVNGTSTIVFPAAGGSETRTFGNYCTSPSGGLTLGFWSNKNGCKILTGSTTGTVLYPAVVTLLNSCQLRNANGTVHTFTNSYSAFRTWLLGATATNMAYMLSAQLATLELDVSNHFVDGNAYDLCSSSTVNTLIQTGCDQLAMDGNTVSGNPTRMAQEMLKNCMDAINNNGAVIPVTPCPYTFPNPPTPCP